MSVLSSCRTSYQGPVSDHFDGRRFFNPAAPESKGFGDFLKWQLTAERSPWPKSVPPPAARPALTHHVPDGDLVVTFINHSSFLIQLPGLNILTDPVWSERVSPVSWAGPKRVCAPGLDFESLPPIHLVLISHNHYDHLDVPTLKRLDAVHRPQFLVPLGDKAWLEAEGLQRVQEMDWWQDFQPKQADIKITFTPAQHWSARGLFDRNLSLWGSYTIVHRDQALYFAGDSGYGPHFKDIAARVAPIKLAFLPIGAYEPRWFMRQHHMNPADAVQAHRDLQAEQSIGMHFGCWQLTDESLEAPARDLKLALEQSQVPALDFIVPEAGASYRYRWRGGYGAFSAVAQAPVLGL